MGWRQETRAAAAQCRVPPLCWGRCPKLAGKEIRGRAWRSNPRSSGPTRPGTRSAAAPRSARAATTATPRRSPSGSAACPGHPYEQGFDLRLVPEKLAEPLRWRHAEDGLRQLDERPVPQGRPRRLHRCRVRVMETARLAHLPGADQAVRARCANMLRTPLRGRAAPAAHLVGRQRREPQARSAANRAPPRRRRRGPLPLDRAAAGRPRRGRPDRASHWVIVGGESGPGRGRWSRSGCVEIRDQCDASGRPVLLQAVGWVPTEEWWTTA